MIGTLIAQRAVTRSFEALNNHDLATFMKPWRDDGEFIYPGEIPVSGVYKGKAAVEAWFAGFFEQFPSIRFEVHDVGMRNVFDLVGTNVISVHWDVAQTNRDGWSSHSSGVTIIHLEHGKVRRSKDYLFNLGEKFLHNWGLIK